MASTAPLQLLLFRHTEDKETSAYEEAILRAFQGGKEAGGYLATGEDLGIQLECFSGAPLTGISAAQSLDSFCHSLVIVLIDRALLAKGDDALWDWLSECWKHADDSKGRHLMLPVAMDERVGREFCVKRTVLGSLQLLQSHMLGEYAIRAAMLALRALHESRVLLASALPITPPTGKSPAFLRLFISHAKMDGLPLAHALKHQIEKLKWLQDFYDADDLPAGSNWQKELENGVGSSLIVMLRTEHYDSRYWCQQEVLWADEYATPAVLVDARTGLQHSAGALPYDRVPTVRIPDGNLVRILFMALREGLRFLHFMRRVEDMKTNGDLPTPVDLRAFSFAPSMSALLRACRMLVSTKSPGGVPQLILYPDPVLRTGVYEAAAALVEKFAPEARLVTPNTLAATVGTV